MRMSRSAGARFRQALKDEQPLQIAGTIIANRALMARHAGSCAADVSGAAVAAGSLGLPGLGINTLDEVLTDARRSTDVCDPPLPVDIDTGLRPSASSRSCGTSKRCSRTSTASARSTVK
jgi:methylisocitrate lyase